MKLVVANLFRFAALGLLLILLFRTEWLSFILVPLTSNNAPPVYTQNSLPSLAFGHLELVVFSIVGSAILAVLAGGLVTPKSGEDFLPLSRATAHARPAFPPAALPGLAVPAPP
ncbi:ABC transporter permease, partial [Rhizobium sp. SEMIA 4085]|nr:ABC transporter permease [Rhizobium sp. SEMIA 4085]